MHLSIKLILPASLSLLVPKVISYVSSKLVFLCPWECLWMGKLYVGISVLSVVCPWMDGKGGSKCVRMHKSNDYINLHNDNCI